LRIFRKRPKRGARPEGTGEGDQPSRPPMAGRTNPIRLSCRHLKEAGDQEFV
jgi:hypothetical protein